MSMRVDVGKGRASRQGKWLMRERECCCDGNVMSCNVESDDAAPSRAAGFIRKGALM